MKKTKGTCLLLVMLAAMAACATAPERRNTHEGLNSTLWMQTSAEYRVLAAQAYHRAEAIVEKALADPAWTAAIEQARQDLQNLPPAIIVDIDETVLDNSCFQAQLALEQQRFSEPLWESWVKAASAESIPGAQEFLAWAAEQKNITVFYITNRNVSVEAYTMKNLKAKGFPVTEGVDVVLSKGDCGSSSSDKSARRRHVCEAYRVLLLAGDDLGDFISRAKDTPENRVKAAADYISYWQDKWILLPNPLYGSWEGALYGYDNGLGDAEILKKKFESLKGYR